MPLLDKWANFYVIVGSSAGALIGLQFVVMTLLAEIPPSGDEAQAGDAFGTPNVVHFGVVLLLSAIVSAPWNSISPLAVLWGAVGFIGLIYIGFVARRMRSQTAYQTVFEDWLFHLLLPLIAYAALGASACVVFFHPRPALFLAGGAVLLLLFIGIHNAWDTVMYHVFVRKREQEDSERHH